MDVRIVPGDSESATSLAEALTAAFGGDRVSLWRDRPKAEVRVQGGGSDRTVLRVLDTVDRWLDHAGFRSAELWLGERSCRLAARGAQAPGLWR